MLPAAVSVVSVVVFSSRFTCQDADVNACAATWLHWQPYEGSDHQSCFSFSKVHFKLSPISWSQYDDCFRWPFILLLLLSNTRRYYTMYQAEVGPPLCGFPCPLVVIGIRFVFVYMLCCFGGWCQLPPRSASLWLARLARCESCNHLLSQLRLAALQGVTEVKRIQTHICKYSTFAL